MCKDLYKFIQNIRFFSLQNLEIRKKYIIFALTFRATDFYGSSTKIYSQIRLTTHNRERIGSYLCPTRKRDNTYLNNNQDGKSYIKQKVQKLYRYVAA